MKKNVFVAALALGLGLVSTQHASATAVTPLYDTFGAQSTFTFGGSGIPNDAVAVSSFVENNRFTWTLGLAATPRFSGPALTNDGAGTFTAQTGTTLSPTNVSGSTWNIGFYTSVSDAQGSIPSGSTFRTRLYYDLDPGVGTQLSSHGILTRDNPSNSIAQGSQNMAFNFWTLPFSNQPAGGGATASNSPQGGTFNPLATGEYTFQLALVDDNGNDVADSLVAIRVNVVDPQANVPLPGTLALLLLGIGGIALGKRRQA